MFDDFTTGLIIGFGLCSGIMAIWIWFLSKTKIGQKWIIKKGVEKLNR